MVGKIALLLELSLVIFQFAECQILRRLGNPCRQSANYDGTDISRPYTVDNSSGTPVYTYLNVEGYHAPSHSKRAAVAYASRLWPYGIIPYDLSSNFPAAEREKILDGMRHWEEHTCIRFYPIPVTRMYPAGVEFVRGSGCCSVVGRERGYIQPVSIAPSCSFATVVHEIGHVVGFWHEQSRPDRDQHINIHTQNIRPGYIPDFNKAPGHEVTSLGVPYDYNSIMHYSQYAFARPGTITISTREDGIPFGRAPELSRLDIIQTELLYKEQCRLRSSSVSRLPAKVPTPSPVILPAGQCNRHIVSKTGQILPLDTPYKSNTTCIWVVEVPVGYNIRLEVYNVELDSPCLDGIGNYIVVHSGYSEAAGRINKMCGSFSYRKVHITGRYAYIKLLTSSEVNSERLKGFSRMEFTAVDINECNSNYCDHSCENLAGSYKCSCREGYYLAGTRRCFDINECGYSNGNCSHKCVNMGGSYRCECPPGYNLVSNKRDCLRGELPCQRNNGGCEQICTDTLNGAECSCRKGYWLFAGRVCAEINECNEDKDICGTNVCFNIPGDYLCLCNIGYRQTANKSCEDIDECSNGNRCSLNQRCVNTPGSYHCECNTGYVNTSRGCVDINECLSDNGGCDHTCVNTKGSFQCLCNSSYVLAADNKTCINHCKGSMTIREPSGNISTAGYPASLYASNSNCTWVIDLPVEYNRVELKFDEMSIEESPNCVKDQLTILNGKDEDSLPMANYCGTRSPFTILSSMGSVTIRFVSDDVINKKGFSLQYRGLAKQTQGVYKCDDVTLKENTTFALTTFPLNYTDPMNCTYSLIAPLKGYKVKLKFLYLDIQDAECSKDRIELYNGRFFNPKRKLADICNGTRVTEFISRGRYMIMRYVGNTLNKYRGFHASLLIV